MLISRVVLFSSANRSGEEIYTVRRARESLLDGFAQDAQLTRSAENCDVFLRLDCLIVQDLDSLKDEIGIRVRS